MRTGIFIRAKVDGEWQNVDIGDHQLSTEVVLEWLRSRGGYNPWAENVVLRLLDRDQVARYDMSPERFLQVVSELVSHARKSGQLGEIRE